MKYPNDWNLHLHENFKKNLFGWSSSVMWLQITDIQIDFYPQDYYEIYFIL